MGLWDYEEEVEAYVPGQASSSDSPSESEDSPTPRTKRGRKRKSAPAAEAARPVVAINNDEDNEELLPDINVISDSDSDDLLEIKASKATPGSTAKSRGGRTPVGHASVEHPEEHLDKDTLQYLNQNQQLLKQLEDDDDFFQPAPAGPSTTYRRTYHAAYVPQEGLSEADRLALASGPQAAASGSGAAPAGDAPDDDGGAKICLRLQAKDRTIKMKINPHNPFSKLIDKYTEHAQAQGWLAAGVAVRLVLDGDVVDPDDTPEGQGLEDDDILEVQH